MSNVFWYGSTKLVVCCRPNLTQYSEHVRLIILICKVTRAIVCGGGQFFSFGIGIDIPHLSLASHAILINFVSFKCKPLIFYKHNISMSFTSSSKSSAWGTWKQALWRREMNIEIIKIIWNISLHIGYLLFHILSI